MPNPFLFGGGYGGFPGYAATQQPGAATPWSAQGLSFDPLAQNRLQAQSGLDQLRQQGANQQRLQAMQGQQAREQANIQAQAQNVPAYMQQARFQTVAPTLLGQLSAPSTAGVGGAPEPQIDANPVWTGQQVQQQVNAGRASNDASTATNVRGAQQRMAGRGFGAQSPLLAALTAQYQGQGLAANADTERNTRWQAAQGNAQQRLAGQTAQEGQYASRQAEANQRRGQDVSYRSSLLQALAGLV